MSDQLVTPAMYITSTNQINKFVGQVQLAFFPQSYHQHSRDSQSADVGYNHWIFTLHLFL